MRFAASWRPAAGAWRSWTERSAGGHSPAAGSIPPSDTPCGLGGDWQVTPDNFVIRLRGGDLNDHAFMAAREQLTEPGFWDNESFWHHVAQALPIYRLSKFQPLMPPWIEREVLSCYLLDVAGAWRWVSVCRV